MLDPDYQVWVKKDPRWYISNGTIRSIVHDILRTKGLKKAELSVVLVGRRKALMLNKQYRKQEYVPQVLAFPVAKNIPGTILGDVIICLPLLRLEAIRENREIDTILAEWLTHGITNLLLE